jgi:hypothetical protein
MQQLPLFAAVVSEWLGINPVQETGSGKKKYVSIKAHINDYK